MLKHKPSPYCVVSCMAGRCSSTTNLILCGGMHGMQALEQTWEWLAEQPGEAAELAALLFEAAPRLGVPAQRASSLSTARSRSLRDPSAPRPDFGTSLKECLAEARPIDIGQMHSE